MEASSSAESARAKAEARRQKIMARQKDRLSAITGTYDQPEPINPEAVPVRPREEPQAAPPQDAAAAAAISTSEQRGWQEQQLESLLAAAQARLQQAQAMAQESARDAATAGVSSGAPVTAQLQLPGSTPTPPGGAGDSDIAPTLVPYLRLGAKLGVAATCTRPLRLLVAVLLAYALIAGLLDSHQVILSPVLFVAVSGLCIILGGLLLGRAVQQSEDEVENALPMRLRQFNLTALFPGAKEALQGLLGFRQVVNGLSEDVSAYLVVCVLLITLTNHWHDSKMVTV